MLVAIPLVASVLALAADPPPNVSPERIPEIAAALAEKLRGKTVRAPDGPEVPLFGAAPAILDEARLLTCLKTIGEAEGWPAAWLVVQDFNRPYDVVLRVALGEQGNVLVPEPVFAAPRREWDADALEAAVREATGKKAPRERTRNVVVQGFRTRVETTYVYEAPKTGREPGALLSLLPAGAVLREARSVDLGDRRPHTLAIALEEGRLRPSRCSSCAARFFGHADSGRVTLVLAGEQGLEDRLDLTPLLRGIGEGALLPRFACAPGDEAGRPEDEDKDFGERFAGREPIRLLDLGDLNGDGVPLEVRLPSQFIDCERRAALVIGVDPEKRKLRVLFERLERDGG
jgi:hypothetical protein